MEHTLAEAATLAEVNRSTILRAIKSGKLSARRLEDKSYRVDASELARVFNVHKALPSTADAMPGRAQAGLSAAQGLAEMVELAELRVKVEALERESETYRETVDDLRKRLDAEQEERRALQRQLSAPVPTTPQPAQEWPSERLEAAEPPKASRGFLARLLGR